MNETTDATAIFAPLWRHKWLILAMGILVAAASYGYYKRQPSLYKATTQLYVGSGSEEQGLLNNTPGKGLSDRVLGDQAALINSNVVGEVVHRRLRREHRQAAAHGKARASAATGNDFIAISAEARTGEAAAQLADAYAQVYVEQQHVSYRHEIRAAIARTRRQLRAIEAGQGRTSKGGGSGRGSAAFSSSAVIEAANLNSKLNQLESALFISGVQQISPATTGTAVLVAPKPRQNAIFGFLLGILLASLAVYALSRFDRRLRSLADIEAAFGAQILTALPTARAPIVHRDGQPAPAASLLEPLRRLHTTLQLGDMLEHDRERSPRVILFVSAETGDGKSTLIADLALAQRDAGERVAVVEADLRRPVQAKLLRVGSSHGLAEVLAGTLSVGEAMQRVGPTSPPQAGEALQRVGSTSSPQAGGEWARSAAGVATMVTSSGAGSLSVLVGGVGVANPPALLARATMTDLLRSLADEYDYVLIDAPSPLEVSDAMPLLHAVDGIVLLARVGHTRQVSAQRLRELLTRVSSAPVLGIVANGVARADMKANGLSPAYVGRRWRRKPIGS
jgi:Mrp family chromosome partitioning ATPase/capsular polysaccharide biosynthesis protein